MAGDLIFIPGQFITPKISAPKALKENEQEEVSGLFNDYEDKPRSNDGKKVLAIVLVVLALALAGWAIYKFVFAKKSSDEASKTEQTQSVPDSSSQNTVPKKDSPGNDNQNKTNPSPSEIISFSNDYIFRAVFKVTKNRDAAEKSISKLKGWGHDVVMYTADSITFKLAELVNLPLSDTTRVKDSLKRFYGSNVMIELK